MNTDKATRFLSKLLDEDTQLIAKHFVDDSGQLKLNDPNVQVAFFNITGVKEVLLAAAQEREAEAKKCDC